MVKSFYFLNSKIFFIICEFFNLGLARIYINGVLERESQQFDVARLPQNWLVNGIGSQFGDDSMQLVDELFIYDRALNISEIRTLVNRCVFNRMIFHYGFANGNKTNTNDQSGLENDGILTGGRYSHGQLKYYFSDTR